MRRRQRGHRRAWQCFESCLLPRLTSAKSASIAFLPANSLRLELAALLGSGCHGSNRIENVRQSLDRRFAIGAQSVPPREPSRVVVGEPGTAFSVLPNQHLQRQIDANRWRRLHEWRSYLGIAEY